MQNQVRSKELISATTIASQIPLAPISIGSTIIAPISKIKVLKMDITAETIPLFKAVKKADPNIAIPLNRKDTAYSFKA